VGEYLREHHPEVLSDPELREHFNHGLFHGFDFDSTMLRIGAMNMLLHGVENPDVRYRDSLSEDSASEENKYTLILANPPFAGSLDYESTSGKLQRVVKTKKTELLFMALFLQLLKPGGRAAVIVPDGVLFGSSNAHKELRRTLVEDHFLEGVVSLPSGVFRPYAGVSTAILLFTKTGRGGTDFVWFYDMTADGWSLDDKRNPLLPLEKLGPTPKEALAEGEHDKNNLPDCLARWRQRKDAERERERTAQSFCVPKDEIAAQGYDLSLNRYKELVHAEVEHRPPLEILAELRAIEQEILQGIEELEEVAEMDYPVIPLGEVAHLIRGITYKPSDVCEANDDEAVACMRTKNVQEALDQSDIVWIPASLIRNRSKYIHEGDILVSSANSWNLVGKACWVPDLQYRLAREASYPFSEATGRDWICAIFIIGSFLRGSRQD
jgi:type I restriction enzyme M protein